MSVEIVARLVPAIEPEKLILFGSRAVGRAGLDSDYDILIVKDEPEPRRGGRGRFTACSRAFPSPSTCSGSLRANWKNGLLSASMWRHKRCERASSFMKKPADLAALLVRKAEHDLAAARIGFEHGAPFTHELRQLLELALPFYPALADFAETIPEYTEFAVTFR